MRYGIEQKKQPKQSETLRAGHWNFAWLAGVAPFDARVGTMDVRGRQVRVASIVKARSDFEEQASEVQAQGGSVSAHLAFEKFVRSRVAGDGSPPTIKLDSPSPLSAVVHVICIGEKKDPDATRLFVAVPKNDQIFVRAALTSARSSNKILKTFQTHGYRLPRGEVRI